MARGSEGWGSKASGGARRRFLLLAPVARLSGRGGSTRTSARARRPFLLRTPQRGPPPAVPHLKNGMQAVQAVPWSVIRRRRMLPHTVAARRRVPPAAAWVCRPRSSGTASIQGVCIPGRPGGGPGWAWPMAVAACRAGRDTRTGPRVRCAPPPPRCAGLTAQIKRQLASRPARAPAYTATTSESSQGCGRVANPRRFGQAA